MTMNRLQFHRDCRCGSFFAAIRNGGAVRGCGHQCSLLNGTMFEATKLALTRWFLAMQLLTQAKNNISALELMRQIGVSYRTAWLMKHKIMESMRLREQPRELDGRVEMVP